MLDIIFSPHVFECRKSFMFTKMTLKVKNLSNFYHSEYNSPLLIIAKYRGHKKRNIQFKFCVPTVKLDYNKFL